MIKYTPIILWGRIVFDKRNVLLLKLREKGTSRLLLDVEIKGQKDISLIAFKYGWSSEAYVFKKAIKGRIYQIRTAVKDEDGNISAFSDWTEIINNKGE